MPDGYAACEVRAKFSAKQPLRASDMRAELLSWHVLSINKRARFGRETKLGNGPSRNGPTSRR
jgi:hypothetical protein